MVVKTVSSKAGIVHRAKGHNAVDEASYISREKLECERTGEVCYPKYAEDLVFSQIMLPEGAPEQFKDRSVLWNSVENVEKRKDAQVARKFRISLPNEWSYELATTVMQDYVRRNFTSQGMCCDFAIHDSENKRTHQRNLHCHIMLTMRPLTETGEWGDKQHFIYKLDKDGNKIKRKNGKGYEGHSEPTTDWNSKEKATEWRRDLAETINATNQRIGNTEVFWEWRSFKERGLDLIPEVHLGAKASALENKGVRTERGDINRRIRLMNSAVSYAKESYVQAKQLLEEQNHVPAETGQRTEITDMLDEVQGQAGRLALPIVSGRYLAKIPNRERVMDIENALRFLRQNHIDTFEQLEQYRSDRGREFEERENVFRMKWQRLEQLKLLAELYADYEPYKQVHDMSRSLSGLKKKKYDREHERELARYEETRAYLKNLLSEGEKIAPKAWKKEQDGLEQEMPQLKEMRARDCRDLAFAEVIGYNRKNLERIEHNQRGRGRNRSVDRISNEIMIVHRNEEVKMNFTENEKRLLFVMEGRGKSEVQHELCMIGRYTRNSERKQAVESLYEKLREVSDSECRELVGEIQKNYHLPAGAKTIGEQLAEARRKSGAEKLSGHDIMGLERFEEDTRHMVILEVISDDCPIGDRGEKMRLFLTDEGYRKMKERQEQGQLKLKNHASVRNGALHYDHRDREL